MKGLLPNPILPSFAPTQTLHSPSAPSPLSSPAGHRPPGQAHLPRGGLHRPGLRGEAGGAGQGVQEPGGALLSFPASPGGRGERSAGLEAAWP